MVETVNKINDDTIEIVKTATVIKVRNDLEKELALLKDSRIKLDEYYENHVTVSNKNIAKVEAHIALLS